jgi:hypothetical protein
MELKNVKNCHAMGGSKIIKNRLFWAGGVRGGQIYKLFEISALSTKAPPIFDPKLDPQKGPYKNDSPHK